MLAYRLETLTEGQIACQDPFGGHGIRLPLTNVPGQEEAEQKLRELFGAAPYVVFSSHAWLDRRGLPEGVSNNEIEDIWRGILPGYRQ
jgi:hypothetical protein